jgi:hypothetical protein
MVYLYRNYNYSTWMLQERKRETCSRLLYSWLHSLFEYYVGMIDLVELLLTTQPDFDSPELHLLQTIACGRMNSTRPPLIVISFFPTSRLKLELSLLGRRHRPRFANHLCKQTLSFFPSQGARASTPARTRIPWRYTGGTSNDGRR